MVTTSKAPAQDAGSGSPSLASIVPACPQGVAITKADFLKPDFSGSPAVPSWRPTFGDGSQWLTSGALHDATYDAGVTLLLLQLYEAALATGSLPQMQSVLNATPIAPTFRKLNPYVDGVCMGNKKECRCQAPRIYN